MKNLLQIAMVGILSVIMGVYAIGNIKAKKIQREMVQVNQKIYVDDNFILKQIEKKYYNRKITKNDIDVVIKIIAKKQGIRKTLIKAMIIAESNYKHYAVSHCGAAGLMQLMPDTAKELGVKDRFNPVQNVCGGVKYIKMLLNEFDGNLTLALASYNAGIGTVKRFGRVPRYKETINYIEKVNQYMV